MSSPEDLRNNVTHPMQTIPRLFAAQVAKTPDAAALVSGDLRLTYRALDAWASAVARALQDHGTEIESPVGLLLPRCPAAVAAILGIVKAGGVYVPLDAGWPPAWLSNVVERAGTRIVLTRADAVAALPPHVDSVLIDERCPDLRAPSTAVVNGDPRNAVSVLATSGSTGRPKLIVSVQRGIANGLTDTPFDSNGTAVCSLNASLTFGFAVAQLFLPLLSGACVVLVEEGLERELPQLVELWERERVTHVALVTPQLRQLLQLGPRLTSRLSSLRSMVIGGAPLLPEVGEAFHAQLPNVTLINGYAATEIGGAALVRKISGHEPADDSPWSVGQPFANTRAHVSDERLNRVSDGVTGELCIGAPHLARGYLSQPALTAERFVPDPFGSDAGARLYRTGDLGRLLANGQVEVLGRTDDLVKVRGFRIELCEIERALARHPAVQMAAAAAPAVNGERQLVGYVVPYESRVIDIAELRAQLRQSLPPHMVPGKYVMLDRLPLTAMGKVDRPMLPAPAPERALSVEYEAPRTELERALAEVWTTTLRISEIGVNDHFVELGGDSMLATEVTGAIADRFGLEISTVSLLTERPTIAALAAHLESVLGVAPAPVPPAALSPTR